MGPSLVQLLAHSNRSGALPAVVLTPRARTSKRLGRAVRCAHKLSCPLWLQGRVEELGGAVVAHLAVAGCEVRAGS